MNETSNLYFCALIGPLKLTRNGVRHQIAFRFRKQVNWGFLCPITVGYGPPDALVPVIESKDKITVLKV